MTYSIHYRSDVVDLGRDEDGTTIEGLRFYVIAEDERGSRWAHRHSLLNRERGFDEEDGVHFWKAGDDRAEARIARLAERITSSHKAGTPLDMSQWYEIDPAYGSAAFQELDALAYFRDREVVEARDRGEPGMTGICLMGAEFA